MAGTRAALGSEVLDDFERLTQGATEERLERMAKLGITREVTGGRYGMVYLYKPYMDILERGTEPL